MIGDVGASLRGTHHMDAPHDHDALSCARDGLERFACWVVGVHVMANETLNINKQIRSPAIICQPRFPVSLS